ncbi:MAG: FtsQ-type POTRA domain-containing protein [Bacillota bacterium]
MDKRRKGNDFKGAPGRDPNRYAPSYAKKSADASSDGQKSPAQTPLQDKQRKYRPARNEDAPERPGGSRISSSARDDRLRPEGAPSAMGKPRGRQADRNDAFDEARRASKTAKRDRFSEPPHRETPFGERPRQNAPIPEQPLRGPSAADQPRRKPSAPKRSVPSKAEEDGRRSSAAQKQRDDRRQGDKRSASKTAKKTAKKTAENKKALAPEEKKAALQRRLSFIILLVAWVAILGIAAFVLRVQSIDVLGCKRYSAEEVRAASGIALYSQIYFTDLDGAAKRIEENPYLDVTDISRAFPDRIVITVRERQEKAAIFFQNLVVIIDGEGYVLSIGNRADLSGLIAVEGMQASGFSVNQRLGDETDFYANTLVAILQALDAKGLADKIESVDISNPLRVCMDTLDGVEVLVGQPVDLEDKMDKLAKILPELERLGAANGTLSLSAKGDPVYSPSAMPSISGSPSPSISPSPTP